mmetsp:Transcript_16772/g.28448  ORF Transcript_16772/g.28448 Transcript_16772/m.28448 type:complete len:283 (+) Transcript_16772:83-931(+)
MKLFALCISLLSLAISISTSLSLRLNCSRNKYNRRRNHDSEPLVGLSDTSLALTASNGEPEKSRLALKVLVGLGMSLTSVGLFFSANSIFETANDIPSKYFKDKKEITAVVIKITDGDTYRVRHVTAWKSSTDYTGKLSENTIAVRIAAVDTPEIAKFGKPGQAFSEEAKEFAASKLLGKRVSIKLLARDRYGRVLGLVKYKDNKILPSILSRKKDISEQLLERGLAVVYRQSGAEYDGPIEHWNQIEKKAIRSKKGVWKNGKDKAVLPSDFKKAAKEFSKI